MLNFVFPSLAIILAVLYLRRATLGLENHLKPVSVGLYALAFFEVISLAANWRSSNNVSLYQLVAPFGVIWIVEHLILLLTIIILGRWVIYYLLKRLMSQLLMIFSLMTVSIFLLTTVTFTAVLLRNFESETLRRLETDVKVLSLALESKKTEVTSVGELVAGNEAVRTALIEGTKRTLAETAEKTLIAKRENLLVITGATGQVLARGEDRERIGDSISDDPLVKKALGGETVSTVVRREGVLGPELSVRAAVPIRDESEKEILGVVLVGSAIDNAFVDGVKRATGLEAAVYGDNILSASTVLIGSEQGRYIGAKEERGEIKERVLGKGESWSGSVNLLNTPYFGAYLPVKDVDGNPAGMFLVGVSQFSVLQTAGRSIELTFGVAVLLLILSVIPSYLAAGYLVRQLK